jgi:antitoxin MazE
MKLNIIQVGDSHGVLLPKAVIDEYQIKESVELRLKEGYIELRPSKRVREN